MPLIANTKRRSIAHGALTVLAAVALSTAAVTGALAAGHGDGGAGHEGSGDYGDRMGRGFGGSLPTYIPEMPPPTFNPSYPNTLPESPETPVSPASPGSIFGNG